MIKKLGGFFLYAVILSGCNLSPGSYPYAEIYEIESNENSVIDIIHEFKNLNPTYAVPKDIPLKDGRRNEKDYWYHFYFYDLEKNQIIKTWVRSTNHGKTNFALVAVYDPNFSQRWKFVNKDFVKDQNLSIKERFENEILQQVTKMLEQHD